MPILGAVAKLRVSGRPEERIAALAAAQRGRVSRRQLLAAGLSRDLIRRRARRGVLFELLPGVYAVGHRGPVELGAETAALLAFQLDPLLTAGSAGRLWDMGLPPSGAIEILVGGGTSTRPAGVTVHRTRLLTPRDRRVRHGLPVTSPAFTLYALAGTVTGRVLERACDRALTAGHLFLSDLAELYGRVRGRPGAPALGALLERERQGATITRSQAEEMFLALIRTAGLPEPELNVTVAGLSVDFLWRAQRLVVEIDGFRFHRTRGTFESDHRRDAILRAADHDVQRYTPSQILTDAYAAVAGVATALGRRGERAQPAITADGALDRRGGGAQPAIAANGVSAPFLTRSRTKGVMLGSPAEIE